MPGDDNKKTQAQMAVDGLEDSLRAINNLYSLGGQWTEVLQLGVMQAKEQAGISSPVSEMKRYVKAVREQTRRPEWRKFAAGKGRTQELTKAFLPNELFVAEEGPQGKGEQYIDGFKGMLQLFEIATVLTPKQESVWRKYAELEKSRQAQYDQQFAQGYETQAKWIDGVYGGGDWRSTFDKFSDTIKKMWVGLTRDDDEQQREKDSHALDGLFAKLEGVEDKENFLQRLWGKLQSVGSEPETDPDFGKLQHAFYQVYIEKVIRDFLKTESEARSSERQLHVARKLLQRFKIYASKFGSQALAELMPGEQTVAGLIQRAESVLVKTAGFALDPVAEQEINESWNSVNHYDQKEIAQFIKNYLKKFQAATTDKDQRVAMLKLRYAIHLSLPEKLQHLNFSDLKQALKEDIEGYIKKLPSLLAKKERFASCMKAKVLMQIYTLLYGVDDEILAFKKDKRYQEYESLELNTFDRNELFSALSEFTRFNLAAYAAKGPLDESIKKTIGLFQEVFVKAYWQQMQSNVVNFYIGGLLTLIKQAEKKSEKRWELLERLNQRLGYFDMQHLLEFVSTDIQVELSDLKNEREAVAQYYKSSQRSAKLSDITASEAKITKQVDVLLEKYQLMYDEFFAQRETINLSVTDIHILTLSLLADFELPALARESENVKKDIFLIMAESELEQRKKQALDLIRNQLAPYGLSKFEHQRQTGLDNFLQEFRQVILQDEPTNRKLESAVLLQPRQESLIAANDILQQTELYRNLLLRSPGRLVSLPTEQMLSDPLRAMIYFALQVRDEQFNSQLTSDLVDNEMVSEMPLAYAPVGSYFMPIASPGVWASAEKEYAQAISPTLLAAHLTMREIHAAEGQGVKFTAEVLQSYADHLMKYEKDLWGYAEEIAARLEQKIIEDGLDSDEASAERRKLSLVQEKIYKQINIMQQGRQKVIGSHIAPIATFWKEAVVGLFKQTGFNPVDYRAQFKLIREYGSAQQVIDTSVADYFFEARFDGYFSYPAWEGLPAGFERTAPQFRFDDFLRMVNQLTKAVEPEQWNALTKLGVIINTISTAQQAFSQDLLVELRAALNVIFHEYTQIADEKFEYLINQYIAPMLPREVLTQYPEFSAALKKYDEQLKEINQLLIITLEKDFNFVEEHGVALFRGQEITTRDDVVIANYVDWIARYEPPVSSLEKLKGIIEEFAGKYTADKPIARHMMALYELWKKYWIDEPGPFMGMAVKRIYSLFKEAAAEPQLADNEFIQKVMLDFKGADAIHEIIDGKITDFADTDAQDYERFAQLAFAYGSQDNCLRLLKVLDEKKCDYTPALNQVVADFKSDNFLEADAKAVVKVNYVINWLKRNPDKNPIALQSIINSFASSYEQGLFFDVLEQRLSLEANDLSFDKNYAVHMQIVSLLENPYDQAEHQIKLIIKWLDKQWQTQSKADWEIILAELKEMEKTLQVDVDSYKAQLMDWVVGKLGSIKSGNEILLNILKQYGDESTNLAYVQRIYDMNKRQSKAVALDMQMNSIVRLARALKVPLDNITGVVEDLYLNLASELNEAFVKDSEDEFADYLKRILAKIEQDEKEASNAEEFKRSCYAGLIGLSIDNVESYTTEFALLCYCTRIGVRSEWIENNFSQVLQDITVEQLDKLQNVLEDLPEKAVFVVTATGIVENDWMPLISYFSKNISENKKAVPLYQQQMSHWLIHLLRYPESAENLKNVDAMAFAINQQRLESLVKQPYAEWVAMFGADNMHDVLFAAEAYIYRQAQLGIVDTPYLSQFAEAITLLKTDDQMVNKIISRMEGYEYTDSYRVIKKLESNAGLEDIRITLEATLPRDKENSPQFECIQNTIAEFIRSHIFHSGDVAIQGQLQKLVDVLPQEMQKKEMVREPAKKIRVKINNIPNLKEQGFAQLANFAQELEKDGTVVSGSVQGIKEGFVLALKAAGLKNDQAELLKMPNWKLQKTAEESGMTKVLNIAVDRLLAVLKDKEYDSEVEESRVAGMKTVINPIREQLTKLMDQAAQAREAWQVLNNLLSSCELSFDPMKPMELMVLNAADIKLLLTHLDNKTKFEVQQRIAAMKYLDPLAMQHFALISDLLHPMAVRDLDKNKQLLDKYQDMLKMEKLLVDMQAIADAEARENLKINTKADLEFFEKVAIAYPVVWSQYIDEFLTSEAGVRNVQEIVSLFCKLNPAQQAKLEQNQKMLSLIADLQADEKWRVQESFNAPDFNAINFEQIAPDVLDEFNQALKNRTALIMAEAQKIILVMQDGQELEKQEACLQYAAIATQWQFILQLMDKAGLPMLELNAMIMPAFEKVNIYLQEPGINYFNPISGILAATGLHVLQKAGLLKDIQLLLDSQIKYPQKALVSKFKEILEVEDFSNFNFLSFSQDIERYNQEITWQQLLNSLNQASAASMIALIPQIALIKRTTENSDYVDNLMDQLIATNCSVEVKEKCRHLMTSIQQQRLDVLKKELHVLQHANEILTNDQTQIKDGDEFLKQVGMLGSNECKVFAGSIRYIAQKVKENYAEVRQAVQKINEGIGVQAAGQVTVLTQEKVAVLKALKQVNLSVVGGISVDEMYRDLMENLHTHSWVLRGSRDTGDARNLSAEQRAVLADWMESAYQSVRLFGSVEQLEQVNSRLQMLYMQYISHGVFHAEQDQPLRLNIIERLIQQVDENTEHFPHFGELRFATNTRHQTEGRVQQPVLFGQHAFAQRQERKNLTSDVSMHRHVCSQVLLQQPLVVQMGFAVLDWSCSVTPEVQMATQFSQLQIELNKQLSLTQVSAEAILTAATELLSKDWKLADNSQQEDLFAQVAQVQALIAEKNVALQHEKFALRLLQHEKMDDVYRILLALKVNEYTLTLPEWNDEAEAQEKVIQEKFAAIHDTKVQVDEVAQLQKEINLLKLINPEKGEKLNQLLKQKKDADKLFLGLKIIMTAIVSEDKRLSGNLLSLFEKLKDLQAINWSFVQRSEILSLIGEIRKKPWAIEMTKAVLALHQMPSPTGMRAAMENLERALGNLPGEFTVAMHQAEKTRVSQVIAQSEQVLQVKMDSKFDAFSKAVKAFTQEVQVAVKAVNTQEIWSEVWVEQKAFLEQAINKISTTVGTYYDANALIIDAKLEQVMASMRDGLWLSLSDWARVNPEFMGMLHKATQDKSRDSAVQYKLKLSCLFMQQLQVIKNSLSLATDMAQVTTGLLQLQEFAHHQLTLLGDTDAKTYRPLLQAIAQYADSLTGALGVKRDNLYQKLLSLQPIDWDKVSEAGQQALRTRLLFDLQSQLDAWLMKKAENWDFVAMLQASMSIPNWSDVEQQKIGQIMQALYEHLYSPAFLKGLEDEMVGSKLHAAWTGSAMNHSQAKTLFMEFLNKQWADLKEPILFHQQFALYAQLTYEQMGMTQKMLVKPDIEQQIAQLIRDSYERRIDIVKMGVSASEQRKAYQEGLVSVFKLLNAYAASHPEWKLTPSLMTKLTECNRPGPGFNAVRTSEFPAYVAATEQRPSGGGLTPRSVIQPVQARPPVDTPAREGVISPPGLEDSDSEDNKFEPPQ